MLTLSRRTVTALVASLGLSALLAVSMSAPAAAADDREIAQALLTGGLVIVVRHGATFPDQADTDPLNFDNIAAQRNLNDKGKMLARQYGDALRRAGVPIGTTRASIRKAALSCLQTRITVVPMPFEKCSPPRPNREPTPFS